MRRLFRKPVLWTLSKIIPPKIGKRVICMHSIAEEDLGLFRERMEWLKRNYYVLSIVELMRSSLKSLYMEGYSGISLTFDDVATYDRWENVLNALSKLEIPALFFVHKHKNIETDINSHSASSLWTLGDHTKTHRDLGMIIDRQTLERETQGYRYFAYPFGMRSNLNPTVKGFLCSKVSYAFTCIPGFVTEDSDPYEMPRDSLDIHDPEWYWRAKLAGQYDWLYRRIHR